MWLHRCFLEIAYFFCHSHNTQNEKVKKKLWMCQFVLFWYSMKKQYKHKACAVPFVAVHWTHTSTIKLEYCFKRTSPLTYGNCLTLQSVLWEHMKLRLHCHWEFHKNYDFFKRIAMASRLIKASHTIRTISQVIIIFGQKYIHKVWSLNHEFCHIILTCAKELFWCCCLLHSRK